MKWSDFDFDALTVTVQRGGVHGRIADTKTEASTNEPPLDPAFAELLKEWQTKGPESEAGWVFASYDGTPFHAAPIQQDYFRPAGRAIGLKGELGWHAFRHSYRSMLDASGAPIGAAEVHAARSGEYHHERLWLGLHGREAESVQQGCADGAS